MDICCGVNRPLSNAILSLGGDCFSFDVLVHVSYDIFDDVVFERLLRICASGIVGYNANSPACKEYSRLKLKPNGPPALRTPEFLEGKPGISANDLLSVQESRLMLTRCVLCASLTFDAGGHSHLEQPPSAMSWQEPEVQSFISTCRCHCTVVAACHFDRDWAKSWMFCTTCEEVSSLACICPHGPQSHQQIAGVRTESGAYLSRYTAEYPPLLATAFAKCILGLIDHHGQDFSLDEIETHIPRKDLHGPPFVRTYPLRSSTCILSGFSLDIKSAHKRMAVHPDHRGLLGFSLGEQLYFYNVCPFGAVFSAHFWSRFGGFLIRMFHLLAWVAHAGFLYVDDLLMFQDSKMMPVTACLIVIFCQLCRIPISWRKCEIGPSIRWIGWEWNLSVGYVSLPSVKLEKIKSLIQKLSHSDRTSRKTLEQFLGLAMWISQLFPSMRTWLHSLYHDLYAIPASNFSISQDNWNSIFNCVTNDLVFHTCPPQTSIPIGGKLIQVRHQPVSSVDDLYHCYLSDRRIWLRIRDPASSKRRLSNSSIRTMTMYQRWLREIPPAISIWPKQYWPGICVADAFASGSSAGIGGIVYFPSSECKWFCLPLCKADFDALDIPLHSDLQRDITSLETLAQIALLFIVARRQPGFRMSVRVPALSDNSGSIQQSVQYCTSSGSILGEAEYSFGYIWYGI